MFNPPVIALVDDDEDIRDALSDLLLAMGYTCEVFDRAEAFLAANITGRFDCLITDIRMPGISGLDLLDRLEAAGSTMPVIVITSVTDRSTRARAITGGAHAYLTKPVTDDALLQCLRSALPGRQTPLEEEGPSGT